MHESFLLVSDLIIERFNLYFPKIWLLHKARTLNRLNDCLFPEGKKLKVDFRLQGVIETKHFK